MSNYVNTKKLFFFLNKDNFNDAKLARECQVPIKEPENTSIAPEKECTEGACPLPPTQHLQIRVRF